MRRMIDGSPKRIGPALTPHSARALRAISIASALGVASAYLQNVKRLAQENPSLYQTPIWIGSYAGGGLGGINTSMADGLTALNSLSAISSNLSNLESAFNPSSNSSGGGFGGGSFGGSGGGGGDSAG